MRVVHESADGDRRVLATDVETADSLFAQLRGLMGRASVPEDYALVFPVRRDPVKVALASLPVVGRFVDPDQHGVHMLFVRTPLDVLWVEDEVVVEARTLAPWTGRGEARADTLIELDRGAADGVEPGDSVRVVEGTSGTADVDASSGDDPTSRPG